MCIVQINTAMHASDSRHTRTVSVTRRISIDHFHITQYYTSCVSELARFWDPNDELTARKGDRFR